MLDLGRLITKNRRQYAKLGKIKSKLCLNFFYSHGSRSWKWKRKFFSDFCIDTRIEMNPHMTIVGKSGSGKSNACRLILKALNDSGIKTIVFDAHNEYVRVANDISAEVYDASYTGINIFALDGVSVKERVSELSDMFKRVFRLGDIQSYTLYKCIRYAYRIAMMEGREARLGDLFFSINVFKKHAERAELNALEGVEKRLMVLNGASFSNNVSFDGLIGKSCIFALSGLNTNEAQKLYIEGFLKRFYTRMLQLEKRDSVRFYLVIDEAEKLDADSMIGRLIAEGRKYGVGILTISQRAKALSESIRGNASMNIIFYQREPEELNYLANLVAGGSELNRFTEVKKAIRNLRLGNAIVVSTAESPIIVGFDLYEIGKSYVGDYITNLAASGIPQSILFSTIGNLGFARQDVEHDLKKLLYSGTVKAYPVPVGDARGTWYITMPRNSAEHDIMVNVINSKLKETGIRSVVYNSSYGPDIMAFAGGRRIAIEYETGLKNIEKTKSMLEYRKGRYDRVVTIVNDKYCASYVAAGIDCISVSDLFGNIDSIFEKK